jgi:hypothetical protein
MFPCEVQGNGGPRAQPGDSTYDRDREATPEAGYVTTADLATDQPASRALSRAAAMVQGGDRMRDLYDFPGDFLR